MVLCHSDFLQFMPPHWQDLAKVDQAIIDEFSQDNKSFCIFMNWLKSLPNHSLKNFVARHPSLCKNAIQLLKNEEKMTYYWIAHRVNNFASRSTGSNVFWVNSERVALPPRWQPAAQEQRLIEHLKTNEQDLANLVEGLQKKGTLFIHDYPRVALATIRIAAIKDPTNQKISETHRKIQNYCAKENSLVQGNPYKKFTDQTI